MPVYSVEACSDKGKGYRVLKPSSRIPMCVCQRERER